MKKGILSFIVALLAITCFGQTKGNKIQPDTSAYVANIDFGLMDRVLSQKTDTENAPHHSMINASFRICAKRLRMVTGKNRNYLIDFFNQVLQAASRSILSDGSVEENFMRILRNEEDAITYVLKYPTVDLEQEYISGKSKLAPLTLN